MRDGLLREGNVMQWMEQLLVVTKWFGSCIVLLEGLLTYIDRVFVPQNKDMLHVRYVRFGFG